MKYTHRPLFFRYLCQCLRFIRDFFPDAFRLHELFDNPYASSMKEETNALYRLLLPRFLKRVQHEMPYAEELKQAKQKGVLIYVVPAIGQLEYHCFAHFFRQHGLPLPTFVTDISTYIWMKWNRLKSYLLTQCELLESKGEIPGPITSGFLRERVAAGESVMLRIPSTYLADDALFSYQAEKRIIETLKAYTPDRPLYFVPIDFIWDRRPTKEKKSFIDILFGEKDDPGSLRKGILFWRNYKRHALIRLGRPLHLEVEQDCNLHLRATDIRRHLVEVMNIEHRTISGSPLRPRHWFLEQVLSDPHLEKQLETIAIENRKPIEELSELAKKYIHEIAANIDYNVIELASRLFDTVFSSLHENFHVDQKQIEELKQLAATRSVVLVPNHRSHLDYLILPSLLYKHHMSLPHFAAGKNLSFWPLGPLFRRGGAYFIRRTFKGNQLYRAVLETYLKLLIKEGYSQAFFIEGARSRTGKLAPPKLGMLSMLYDAAKHVQKDLVFFPVSFTYDRVLELGSYINELEGAEKQPENTWALMKLIRFLKHKDPRYGNVHIRFGTPVDTNTIPGDHHNPVEYLAYQLCDEINRHVVVTPLSLVATALLSPGKRAITSEMIQKRVLLYLDYFQEKQILLAMSLTRNARSATATALKQCIERKMVLPHTDQQTPFYEIPDDQRLTLDYIKNNSLHFFSKISLLANILQARWGWSGGEPGFTPSERPKYRECGFTPHERIDEYIFLARLFAREWCANGKEISSADIEPEIAFLQKNSEALPLFAELTRHFFEAYSLAASLKASFPELPNAQLIKLMRETGEKHLLLGKKHHAESLSKALLENALTSFSLLHYSDSSALKKLHVTLEEYL
ncbi:MAG: hypothetical protein A3I05_01190 [Deltaproteobacteria bacterium RIFCSPLOWO2_02_FULL_44_10]|nr:MAG: hypothetical protein A3C46_02425 [Deltaproteobacteria bacterium RIFCSPHIGHO2_02_FULL_44_16]OGQ47341.1 MAG: hypothetical protein A3I05_01190 [Deltaproteobacteria bacterium RIFCSPLOWO2_02_FULL_44_10]